MGSGFYCGIIFWELFQFNAKCLVYLGFLCFLQSIYVYHDDIFLENCPFHLCFQVHTKMCKPCIFFSLCLFPFSFPVLQICMSFFWIMLVWNLYVECVFLRVTFYHVFSAFIFITSFFLLWLEISFSKFLCWTSNLFPFLLVFAILVHPFLIFRLTFDVILLVSL